MYMCVYIYIYIYIYIYLSTPSICCFMLFQQPILYFIGHVINYKHLTCISMSAHNLC